MANEKSNDTNRVTPREVQPDSRRPGGATQSNRSKGDDTSAGRRRDGDNTVEADGGDQAGVAGGSIDGKVSGRGSDRP